MNIELTLVRKDSLDQNTIDNYAPDLNLRILRYNYDNGGNLLCLGDNDNTVIFANNIFTFYDVAIEE